jgi:transcriptional regulator with XRE-family HTH domain
MTLKALAERANMGLSTISDVERGHYIPAGDAIERMANALRVSPCWLAYGIGAKHGDMGDSAG